LLAQVYAACRTPLLRFLQHRLGNSHSAEDAVQESFTRLAASGIVIPPDEQRLYLFQIAANLLRDQAREHVRHGGTIMLSFDDAGMDMHNLPLQAGSCPSVVAEHRERLDRLGQALDELPERQREAFVLHRFDGLTQDEVAERMGISRRMVVKHLRRAFAYCELRVQYASVEQMEACHPIPAGDEV
jgi:RNA polymerase sigma-70 factor (ECF subfamily)